MSAEGPAKARATFIALTPPFQGQRFLMTGSIATIGRSTECDVSLDAVSISRQHARVEERDGRFHVRDLGSRNGIRVGEAAVREADLNDGDILKVGDIQLRFETAAGAAPPEAASAAASPDARPLTGKDILSLVQAQARPAAAPGMPPEEGAPENAPPRVGLNLTMIALIVLALLLSLGAGYWILRRSAANAPVNRGELNPVLVKIGEKRWLRIATFIDIRKENERGLTTCDERDFDVSDAIPVGDTGIADVEKYDGGEILITGKNVGETAATLTLSSGTVLTQQVIVRGRLEDPLEELRYGRYTADQREALASEFLENGVREQRDRPWLSLAEYQKAEAVLSPLAQKGTTYMQAHKRLVETQSAIDNRWTDLRRRIVATMQNNDPKTAINLLKEAAMLIPDPNDPRHQRAHWFIQNLIRQQLLEQERGR